MDRPYEFPLHRSGQSEVAASEKAVKLNSMFLNTKTNMLEIIEEGLQLKLELRSIKEQFAGLLHNFHTFDETGHIPSAMDAKPMSATRARVRAVYEARKARLRAKRMSSGRTDSKQSPARVWKKAKRDHHTGRHTDRNTDQQDKENTHSGRMSPVNSVLTSTPFLKPSSVQRSHSKTVLTPIKEEHWYGATVPSKHRVHRRHSCALTPHVTPICHTPSADYIRLKSSLVASKCDFASMSPNIPSAPNQSRVSDYTCHRNDTSIWSDDSRQSDITIDVSTKGGSPVKESGGSLRGGEEGGKHTDSPVQYASSDEISVVYTNRSLRDISLISKISRSSLREHRSSSNMSGAFHSTFNYPLHSTLNYPLHSTMQCLEEPVVSGDDPQVDSGVKMCASDAVTQSDAVPHSDGSSGIHSTTQSSQCQPDSNHRRLRSVLKQLTDTSDAPVLSQKPHLCREHGLHPTLGGPCIFQTDDSQDQLDHATETDCDSSYLSEHVDDMTFSSTEDYVATYDARNARMKMLRRQTGQTQLKNIRHPIGLSESDLLFEVTQKHMSMDATRASLPDLSVLSTVLGDTNRSESTLIASPKKSETSSHKDSDSVFSPNVTLVDVVPGPTTDESPESNTTLPVPMNSPMTDSGSSSRPTTDNYDYAQVATVKPEMFPAPPSSSQNTNHQGARSSFKRHHHKGSHLVTATRQFPSCNSGKGSTRELRTSQHALRSRNCYETNLSPQTLKRHHMQAHHITISEASGATRTVINHTAVARNLEHHKKKALVKKLKQFNNNFYSAQNLHLQTLGHF